MYKAFFGLNANPFELSPDPFFMVSSEKSKEALASISVAVGRRKGFVVMTGEVGTGKTLVLRSLFELWEREQIPFAYFIGPRLSTVDFLSYINFELGIKVDVPTKGNLLRALYGFLLAQFEKGLTTVLIIDEAHQIPRRVLEEIRLLTNFETSQQKLIQIILAGQPELDKKLDSPELRSLKQRIAVRCTLEPLRPEEIRNYIERRLALAGADAETAASVFPVDTVKAIYRYSQGIQRLINNVCDQALIAACTCQIRVVPVEIIDQIASRFRLEPAPSPKRAQTSVSPASQMQAPAAHNSSQSAPTPAMPVATEDRQDEVQQDLDIEVAAPQAEQANESEAASESSRSDSSSRDQSEPQPQPIDCDKAFGAAEPPAPETPSESRPLASNKFSAGAPGSNFLAACQHLIDQAVASATDLRAIAQSDQIVTTATSAVTQHAAPSSSQADSDTPPEEVISSAEEPAVSAGSSSTASAPTITPSAAGSAAPVVSAESAKSGAPTASEAIATATKPFATEPEAKAAAARRTIQSAAPSTSSEIPKLEPASAPQHLSPPLALAAAANAATAVTLPQPTYKPVPPAPTFPSAPPPSAATPKPEPVRPQTQATPSPLSVSAALSYPSPTTPHPAYSPAVPDPSIKLPDFPEPDALSGYIAALRANRKADYFEKQKEALQPASETADELLSPELSSGEEQAGETDGQTSIKIDRGIFISVIVAGLLILGYAVVRYSGRPSIPGQDAAMAAVAHASSDPAASHPPSQSGATRSITSQAGTKIRGGSNATSDLQTYKQLGEPALAAKKAAPGRPRLAAPTSSSNDAAPEPVIDTQASSVYGLSEGLTAIAHPTNPLPTGGNVKPARLLSSVSPLYPPMARNMRVQGDVHIDAVVDENGHVSAAKVIEGPVLLRQSALDALARWKYQPATLDGKPVQMSLSIVIQFRIQ